MSSRLRLSVAVALAFDFALLSASYSAHALNTQPDVYKNFADLATHEKEGRDFTITVLDRASPMTVLAIHGGRIDLDTHLIAEPLAGKDWNLYVLKGTKDKNNYDLHVTSAHFDEPRALALAARSKRCVSIHGHRSDVPRICIGGANADLRKQVMHSLELSALPFKLEMLCSGLEGQDPTNIVNECQKDGVQLEFSSSLRKQLFANPVLLKQTLAAIRQAVWLPHGESK